MITIGDNEISAIYLGSNEISAIYAGDEQIYPMNLGTLTGISLENLTWVTDVDYTGGTATSANCSFDVYAYYDSGKRKRVTKDSTITGSLVVPATTADTRELVGTLTLTATYSGFTDSDSVDVYQKKYSTITYLDYIYFTGASYVNTGILPDLNTRVEMYGVYITQQQTYFPLFGGCNNDNSGNWFRVRTESSVTNLNGAVGNQRNNLTISYPIDGTITLDKNALVYNNQTLTLNATSMNTSTSYIYIHTDNRNGTPTDTRAIQMRMSEFKIFKNNELVCDLKAAKDENDIVCLYDEISQTYKYNIGSGGLIAG